MTVFGEYVLYYGLPRTLDVDRAAIYETTRDSTVDETLRDASPLTQFGRAMQELDVKLSLAKSPHAKGRVERRHGVFQDRCVKAMRLRGIRSIEVANAYLDSEYLDELNSQFSVDARSKANLHRSAPQGLSLERVWCYQETRVVQNDWTVSWCNRIYQLGVEHQKLVSSQDNSGLRILGWSHRTELSLAIAHCDRTCRTACEAEVTALGRTSM